MNDSNSDDPDDGDPLVGLPWVALQLGLTPGYARARLHAGDPRIPKPLALPGSYRWRKRDVIAHLAALRPKGATDAPGS
jgi:hypothetical protein